MEWVKNNLPLLTLVMIVIGLVRISAFYYAFNINITSFLDITEVIQLQIEFFLPAVIAVFFAYMIFRITLWNPFNKRFKALQSTDEMIDKMSISEEEKEEVKIITKRYREGVTDIYLMLSVTAIMIGGLIGIMISFKNSDDIKHGRAINEIAMTVDGQPVKTDANNMFLGRTKNFIFFYNRNTKQSKIYSNSDVKNLTYMPGNEYITVTQAVADSIKSSARPR